MAAPTNSRPHLSTDTELGENPFALMTSYEGVAKLLSTRAAVLPGW